MEEDKTASVRFKPRDEEKPKIDNINIGVMRTDVETMIRHINNNEGDIEIMRTVGEFYYLLLKTYEVQIEYEYKLVDGETKPIDFFERGG